MELPFVLVLFAGQHLLLEKFSNAGVSLQQTLVNILCNSLMSQCTSTNDHISFKKKHINDCIIKLSGDVTRRCVSRLHFFLLLFSNNLFHRERDDYLSYASRFDYLIRHYTSLMESKRIQARASAAGCHGNFGNKTDRSPQVSCNIQYFSNCLPAHAHRSCLLICRGQMT